MRKYPLLVHCVTGSIFAIALLGCVSAIQPQYELVPLTVVFGYLGALPATALMLKRRTTGRRGEEGRGFTIV
jgi:hypothetical protein